MPEKAQKCRKKAGYRRNSRKCNYLLTLLTVCPVVFRLCQITSTPTNQWADQVTGWQSWTPLPGVFSRVHPGMTVLPPTIRETGFQMPNTNRHLPSAPLSCVQASLCTTSQMLNKDHDTTAADTQLICIVLANYVNICKKIFTAEGWHIMQSIQNVAAIQGYSWAYSLFYLSWRDMFLWLFNK